MQSAVNDTYFFLFFYFFNMGVSYMCTYTIPEKLDNNNQIMSM